MERDIRITGPAVRQFNDRNKVLGPEREIALDSITLIQEAIEHVQDQECEHKLEMMADVAHIVKAANKYTVSKNNFRVEATVLEMAKEELLLAQATLDEAQKNLKNAEAEEQRDLIQLRTVHHKAM